MEDSVFEMIDRSYSELSSALKRCLPKTQEPLSLCSVKEDEFSDKKPPIFELKVVLGNNKHSFAYQDAPDKYVETLLRLLEKPLLLLSKVHDVTPFLVERLFGSEKGKRYIKTPLFSRTTTGMSAEH